MMLVCAVWNLWSRSLCVLTGCLQRVAMSDGQQLEADLRWGISLGVSSLVRRML